jgi:hypothetical protein
VPARKPPPPDEKPQFERFLETAREISAAETDEGLDAVLRKVIPPRRPPSAKRSGGKKKTVTSDPSG